MLYCYITDNISNSNNKKKYKKNDKHNTNPVSKVKKEIMKIIY